MESLQSSSQAPEVQSKESKLMETLDRLKAATRSRTGQEARGDGNHEKRGEAARSNDDVGDEEQVCDNGNSENGNGEGNGNRDGDGDSNGNDNDNDNDSGDDEDDDARDRREEDGARQRSRARLELMVSPVMCLCEWCWAEL